MGRSAASGTGRRRSEVGRNPSAPEPSPSQLSPVAPFHLRTGPGTAAHVLLSESPLPVCLLSDLFPAASHTVTRCPAPCWASDKPPDLGQGPLVIISGRFFPGAWRVSYSCGTGQKHGAESCRFSPAGSPAPRPAFTPPSTGKGRERSPHTQTQVAARASGLRPALNGSPRCAFCPNWASNFSSPKESG